jgi:hypothetical protein
MNVSASIEVLLPAWMLIFYIALSAALPSQHKKSSVLFFFK